MIHPPWRTIGPAALAAAALQACAPQPPPAKPVTVVRTEPPPPQFCADISFPIYFATASPGLTPTALAVIADTAARLKGCIVSGSEVLGLADADGTARANQDLSRRRAQTVARALAAAGLPPPKVEALGQTGATTPSGDPEPLRRRAEVIIRASPPPTDKENGPNRAR
ncbi:MAG: OmpA family protein [Caulobacteraceae bacterium]